jgi:hypothetical protein
MPRRTESRIVSRLDDEMFLTETQLAARHQRSVKTLRNARVSGGYIPFVKIGETFVIGSRTCLHSNKPR